MKLVKLKDTYAGKLDLEKFKEISREIALCRYGFERLGHAAECATCQLQRFDTRITLTRQEKPDTM